MDKKYKVAVVGATGAVGEQMRKVLEERKFPASDIIFLASKRSQGKRLSFNRKGYEVQILDKNSFKGIEIALFSAGSAISKEFTPIAVNAGAVVIDNSSAYRMDDDVPLIVPEVNPNKVNDHDGIIANPNCSTIQMVVALKPIHDYAKIKRVVVSTYQSVSGTGRNAMLELKRQTHDIVKGNEVIKEVYPHQIAFNVLPHIDDFLDDGYTKEEEKMVKETQKILDPSIKITATSVRVPVYVSHSEAVNIECENKITVEKAKELFEKADGITVMDNPDENQYPLPIEAEEKDDVFVGRIRKDDSVTNGLNVWVVSDNLRKGAALNAVQIAELVIKE